MTAAIYPALVRVTRAIAHEGISKTRKNAQQGYNFRGIDEVMNAFAPLLAKEGIFIKPEFGERECIERQSGAGKALFSVTVKGTFEFVAEDASSVKVGPFFGEAMDSADKATNKAMAVAFKYALFQTFCVPLEGVTGGDADATTHEVAPRITPTAGVWESLNPEEQEFLATKAKEGLRILAKDGVAAMADFIDSLNLDTDEKAAIWTRFDSETRSALKTQYKKAA